MGSGVESQVSAGALSRSAPTVVLRLFASARQAAGTGRIQLTGGTVDEVLDGARRRWGQPFAQVLAASRVWVNGSPAGPSTVLVDGDEVAVLPPVSGGCDQ